MVIELVVAGGVVGIAIAIFIVITMLSERPTKALIMSIVLSYALFFVYIHILNKIIKRKAQKHIVVQ